MSRRCIFASQVITITTATAATEKKSVNWYCEEHLLCFRVGIPMVNQSSCVFVGMQLMPKCINYGNCVKNGVWSLLYLVGLIIRGKTFFRSTNSYAIWKWPHHTHSHQELIACFYSLIRFWVFRFLKVSGELNELYLSIISSFVGELASRRIFITSLERSVFCSFKSCKKQSIHIHTYRWSFFFSVHSNLLWAVNKLNNLFH